MLASLCPALLAQTDVALDPFWVNLWHGFVGSLAYGLLGIVLLAFGFKIFDWLNTKIDVQLELAEKQNLSVAVVCAAFIIGVAIIAAVAVR